MQTVTTIGLDIAKSLFQIHGVDAAGNVIVRRQLKRRYVLPFFQKLLPCLIGIEACASSHHCSRELKALGIRCGPRNGDNRTLLLRRASASRPSGEWNDDDYDVLADGGVVGRIRQMRRP
jgi:hypothetical protein